MAAVLVEMFTIDRVHLGPKLPNLRCMMARPINKCRERGLEFYSRPIQPLHQLHTFKPKQLHKVPRPYASGDRKKQPGVDDPSQNPGMPEV